MVPEDFEILIEVARALKIFMEPHFLGVPKGKVFVLSPTCKKISWYIIYMEDKKREK